MSINSLNGQLQHITVNPSTGRYTASVPITTLVGNNGMGPSYNVEFVYSPESCNWFLPGLSAVTRVNKVYYICLSNGEQLTTTESIDAATFKVVIDHALIQIIHKNGTIENLRDLTAPPPIKWVAGQYGVYDTEEKRQARYDEIYTEHMTLSPSHFRLETINTPLGHQLKFEWELWVDTRGNKYSLSHLKSISDESYQLLTFDATVPYQPTSFTLYPQSSESIKFELTYVAINEALRPQFDKYLPGVIYFAGVSEAAKAFNDTLDYMAFHQPLQSIKQAGTLLGAECHFEYADDGLLSKIKSDCGANLGDATTPSYHQVIETLTLNNDKKVATYVFEPGLEVEATTATYTYDADARLTTVSTACGDQTLSELKQYCKENGSVCKEELTVDGVTSVTEQTVEFNQEHHLIIGTTRQGLKDASEEQKAQSFWVMDAQGNMLASSQGDLFTVWTYYNTYALYGEEVSRTKVYDDSFLGYLFRPIDWVTPDFSRNAGLTWATRLDTKSTLSPYHDTYAKQAFNLPIDGIVCPGDANLFCAHVESEHVYRLLDGKMEHLSLKCYGYTSIDPKQEVPNFTRSKVVKPSIKLTVHGPDCKDVDVSLSQFQTVVTGAMQPLKKLGEEYLKLQNQRDTLIKQGLPEGVNLIVELDKKIAPIKAQIDQLLESSTSNTTGTYLNSWAAGSMTVEQTTYHTDKGKPEFGQVKSTVAYLLDEKGKEVTGSRTTTVFTYAVDTTDTTKMKTTVAVTTGDSLTVTSTQTRCRFSGRLHESTDSEGVKTTLTYHSEGYVSKEKVTQGANTVTEVDYSVDIESPYTLFDAKDVKSASNRSIVVDALGRERESRVGSDYLNDSTLSCTEYDKFNRVCKVIDYDYTGADAGTKLSTRTSTWNYTSNNDYSIAHELKDAQDKVTETKTQTVKSDAQGSLEVTIGAVTSHSKYDAAARTLTEWTTPGAPYLATVTSYDVDGQRQKVEYKSVTPGEAGAANTETVLDSVSYTYDARGQLSKIEPKHGKESTFAYDRFGRLLKETTAGTEISNTYSAKTTASIATAASIKASGGSAIALGNQTVDGLGRVSKRTVNGADTTFSYAGGSRWGVNKAATPLPAKITQYSRAFDPQELTYSETYKSSVGFGDKPAPFEYTTATTFSVRGQMVSFSNVMGDSTSCTYDLFGRLIKTSSDAGESSFHYAGNGQLEKETIKDIKTNKEMTVTYAYDLIGREISRTFACDGFDTLTLKQERLDDGRVKKTTLLKGESEYRSDNYSYDDQDRLKEWSCTGSDAPKSGDKSYTKQVFTYDALGNVTSRENESSAGKSTSTYTYDTAKPGVLTKSGDGVLENDAAGRLTKRINREVEYYGNGRLKSYSSEASADSKVYEFKYDDLGRVRVIALGGKSEYYHYRNGKIYGLRQIDSYEPSSFGFYQRSIVLVNDSPGCLLQQIHTVAKKGSSAAAEVTASFELRDAAGSVFASYDLLNTTMKHYSYTPYGFRNPEPTAVTWLGFKGEPLNPLGLYHLGNGYRVYDPQLHRFQSPDDWSPFSAGGAACYTYCGADPVNYHDPSGHARVLSSETQMVGTPFIATPEFRIVMAVVGVAVSPFTGGASVAWTAAAVGLATVSAGFEIASALLEESDPDVSEALGYVGLGVGLASAAAGIAGAKLAARAGAKNYSAGSRAAHFGDLYKGQSSTMITCTPRDKRHLIWYETYLDDPRRGVRHIWGANIEINKSEVRAHLKTIARRGSNSDVHIYSGAHGEPNGDNWYDAIVGGKPSAIRRPELQDTDFYLEDLDYIKRYAPFGNTRKVSVHKLTSKGALETMNTMEQLPGHHVYAFCFGRNDERFLALYNQAPVMVYARPPKPGDPFLAPKTSGLFNFP
ncbi:RHS repeat-associated core domain-containing protein [Pseudomonas sp. B21-035]|uniref:RHS repeat-associated core domain-containing protein n=1 Tax=Pseudomonas sp. B21-035 TaxID=2895484 RepID=UPI00215E6F48|nr:RHS repeat-associated core domain-containing protein [Pseudomonas sp. B21-035]UVL58695.1 hypothetical protein LOY22_12230 [Pseudomonas sp. B21-035]